MNRLSAILLILLAALPGCAGRSIFGYTTHGLYPDHIRTVAVPIFQNTGYRRELEFKLTQEVVWELERVGFKVVPADRADVELIGKISDFAKLGFGLDGFSNPRGGSVNLQANVRYVERRTGRTVNEGEIQIDPTSYGLISTDNFLIDVDQSLASSEDRACRDMAKNIVALLQTPW